MTSGTGEAPAGDAGPGWRQLAIWLSVPLLAVLFQQVFVQCLNYLVNHDSLTEKLKFSADAAMSASFAGHVYVLGAVLCFSALAALFSGAAAIAVSGRILRQAGWRARPALSLWIPCLLAGLILLWFVVCPFYPSVAEHLIDETLDAVLSNDDEARLVFVANAAIGMCLVAWVFSGTAFAALAAAVTPQNLPDLAPHFRIILALGAIPLLASTASLHVYYAAGAMLLADAETPQKAYQTVAGGLVTYWALMASATLGATAAYVFGVIGCRTGSFVDRLQEIKLSEALGRVLTVLAPTLPPLVGGLFEALWK